jgi:hypothetical protein
VIHLSARGIFLASAGTTLVAGAWIVIAQPDSLTRLWRWRISGE